MRFQTIPEAARLLGLTTQQLRRGIAAGRYPSYEINGRTMVDVDALGEIIEAEKRTISMPGGPYWLTAACTRPTAAPCAPTP